MTLTHLKAVIIEDEEDSIHLLSSLISSGGLAEVAGSTTDPDEALNLIVSLNPDVVFLDIKMPGKSGFDILDDLRKIRNINTHIVFITAYNEYAIKAFEYAAFDYLLKPVEPDRLNDTLLRCLDSRKKVINQKEDVLDEPYKKLIFRNASGFVFIDLADIVFIEAEGNYSVFNLVNNRIETVTSLLGKVEEQLSGDMFYRISRSFIINLEYLKKINTKQLWCVLLSNGKEFRCSISREKINALVRKMQGKDDSFLAGH